VKASPRRKIAVQSSERKEDGRDEPGHHHFMEAGLNYAAA
jgi:hypothetical protein